MRCDLATAGRIGAAFLALGMAVHAAEPGLQELLEQNRALQAQVRAQQKTIEELTARTAELLKASDRHERELRDLQVAQGSSSSSAPASSNREHEVRVAGEAGVGFFHTGREGQFPKDEFRVDDP